MKVPLPLVPVVHGYVDLLDPVQTRGIKWCERVLDEPQAMCSGIRWMLSWRGKAARPSLAGLRTGTSVNCGKARLSDKGGDRREQGRQNREGGSVTLLYIGIYMLLESDAQ